MKKIVAITICLISLLNAQSQISDLDAKLQYQKAEDAYESRDYNTASKASEDLKNKMGKWTPKVLFLYLQSVYKSYTANNDWKTAAISPQENFKKFKNLTDSFFLLIDKNTYPPEKYNDILSTQQYFQKMIDETANQSTKRTPQNAVAFLNDCAQKFRGNKGKRATYYYSRENKNDYTDEIGFIKYGNSNIHFSLDSTFLRVVIILKAYGTEKKYNEVSVCNDLIDLQHIPYIDEGKVVNDKRVYCYLYAARDYDRNLDYPKEALFTPKFLEDYKVEYLTSTYLSTRWRTEVKRTIWNDYPILWLFDVENEEFKEGKYAERITEAFWYLMNYYPKEKSKSKEEKKKKEEPKKDLGF